MRNQNKGKLHYLKYPWFKISGAPAVSSEVHLLHSMFTFHNMYVHLKIGLMLISRLWFGYTNNRQSDCKGHNSVSHWPESVLIIESCCWNNMFITKIVHINTRQRSSSGQKVHREWSVPVCSPGYKACFGLTFRNFTVLVHFHVSQHPSKMFQPQTQPLHMSTKLETETCVD